MDLRSAIAAPFLLFPSLLAAAPSERDGFYQISPALKEALDKGNPAGELPLGEEVKLGARKTRIIPRDNKNHRFGLSLAIAQEPGVAEPDNYLLVVGDHILLQDGSGTEGDTLYYLHFEILGRRAAEEIAHFLKTELEYRRHPGHQLVVEFAPTKDSFTVGEPITAKLRIRNAGKKPFAFRKGGMNRARRDNQFRFTAEHNGKPVIDIGSTSNFGGLAVKQVIAPGGVFEDQVDLGKWFAFEEAGFYDILGSYYLEIHTEGDDFESIWEEWVTAQFSLRVEAEKQD